MLKKHLRSWVGALLLALLVLQPVYSVSLSEKETVKIENALEKSKNSLIQQETVINQLKKELKTQSESYRKLEISKIKSNIAVGVTCFVIGAVAGGVAYGVYVYPWLSN